MGKVIARPRRPLRYELYSLAFVLAIPVALFVIFPINAVAMKARDEVKNPVASCSFVTLSEEESSRALAMARGAWRVRTEEIRGINIDLNVSTMPEEPRGAVMSEDARERVASANPVAFRATLLPESLSAKNPSRIAKEEISDDENLKFSKKELLTIDEIQ